MKKALADVKETIVRVWGNIKWLLNHPTTNFTSLKPDGVKCDYCGSENGVLTYLFSNGIRSTVCFVCIFKALDMALARTK